MATTIFDVYNKKRNEQLDRAVKNGLNVKIRGNNDKLKNLKGELKIVADTLVEEITKEIEKPECAFWDVNTIRIINDRFIPIIDKLDDIKFKINDLIKETKKFITHLKTDNIFETSDDKFEISKVIENFSGVSLNKNIVRVVDDKTCEAIFIRWRNDIRWNGEDKTEISVSNY